ncbi:hypothetical protein Ciccas_002514 [Cichlidogyrus casuarinus]|uniref:Uncharacterized protein n=1 Tax=Cichlidogyrus casuarinus TaxID=1844966 RepID=A0ABD2QH21_9PLAT
MCVKNAPVVDSASEVGGASTGEECMRLKRQICELKDQVILLKRENDTLHTRENDLKQTHVNYVRSSEERDSIYKRRLQAAQERCGCCCCLVGTEVSREPATKVNISSQTNPSPVCAQSKARITCTLQEQLPRPFKCDPKPVPQIKIKASESSFETGPMEEAHTLDSHLDDENTYSLAMLPELTNLAVSEAEPFSPNCHELMIFSNSASTRLTHSTEFRSPPAFGVVVDSSSAYQLPQPHNDSHTNKSRFNINYSSHWEPPVSVSYQVFTK